MALFADTLLENSSQRLRTQVLEWTLSLAAHGILVAAMFVVPMYWVDRVEVHPSNHTQLVAATADLLSSAHVTPAPMRVAAATRELAAPKSVPAQVEVSRPQVGEADAGEEMAPDLGGTISAAGQGPLPRELFDGGGILSDISRAHLPPPVAEARPQTPLNVGGKVKAPQLISMVEPAYPPLLRRERVQGDVVIDAVIDIEGNVVEVHTVSGNEFLVAVAMDALRQWKYEPTVLNGRVFPVYLRVSGGAHLDQPPPGAPRSRAPISD
jgi:protein TonB